MEQTYAYSAWFFTRALSLIYLIAFVSLLFQANGLWGSRGVLPIAPYMKAIEQNFASDRYWKVPSLFWLSSSDEMLYGAAMTGAIAAAAALLGFAQGWSLLMCFGLYLSFCSSGQSFMSFQWDALLLEVGFAALLVVPWNLDFSLNVAREPHWFVRVIFYFILFKLMFLSGVVKLVSGDESWRDLSALAYHYWTQPLPTPLAPFVHALPLWFHKLTTALTLAIELIVPFAIFWPRTRGLASILFISISVLILLTGNYTFFNWLTMALCFWLLPDNFWQRLVDFLPFTLQSVQSSMFPHPVISFITGILCALSVVWCLRFVLPDLVLNVLQPVLSLTQAFHISNSYGLFAVMTKTRNEIVVEGSDNGQDWKEYEFKYKPGNIYRALPIVAPHQPRLDWQMWFASLGTIRENVWFENLLLRLFENSPDVVALFADNPFPNQPPKYLRAKLFAYEFTSPGEILNSDTWWSRRYVGDYTPTYTRP